MKEAVYAGEARTDEFMPIDKQRCRKAQGGAFSQRETWKELEIRAQELNLRRACFLLEMLNNPQFPITPETQTVFAHEAFRLVSGYDCLAMLPECPDKYYTAMEISEKLGISTDKIERIAKAQGIKPPEGESNDYGLWIYSKSQYSSREVSSFIYSEYALDWFKRHDGTAS